MKVAIIADWLTTYGGAEHVLCAFRTLWPEAPFFTTVTRPQNLGPLSTADIRPDPFLQRLFKLIGRHEPLLTLMPRAIERIDLTGFDVVISSSHAIAKGVIIPATAIHICYCHTPMRYAWEMEEEYLHDFRIPFFIRPWIRKQLKKIRRWDLASSQRVDMFIANSSETAARIKRVYGRESTVLAPPADDRFFTSPLNSAKIDAPFIAVGRLVPYKRFDLLIELANLLKLPLTIIGRGPDRKRLEKLAGPTVTFAGFVPDADLPAVYASARALLFPQVEDAGIVPIEAQACGTPVIAYAKGGVLDVVKDKATGMLVPHQTVQAFREAINAFSAKNYDPKAIREHALQFSLANFLAKMQQLVSPVQNGVQAS